MGNELKPSELASLGEHVARGVRELAGEMVGATPGCPQCSQSAALKAQARLMAGQYEQAIAISAGLLEQTQVLIRVVRSLERRLESYRSAAFAHTTPAVLEAIEKTADGFYAARPPESER